MRALDDLADVVDTRVGGGVHLEHVGMTGLDDFLAVLAIADQVDGRFVGVDMSGPE